MKDLNFTLKSYIQGQVTVSVILGVILYIGYTIIGLPYTPLLVLFAGVANLIPFLGPWLSFAPAAVLGIIDSPTTFIWVCVVTLIAQQLEGNVITPNVMGKSLSIHPPYNNCCYFSRRRFRWFHTYFNCTTYAVT